MFECTLCGLKYCGGLGQVCLEPKEDGSLCPGIIDQKLARERQELVACIKKYPNRYSTPDALAFVADKFEDKYINGPFPGLEQGRRY